MLYDRSGNRKYLTPQERRAFIVAATSAPPKVATFCLSLAYTGGRISEILALTPSRVDFAAGCITIESLKKRRLGMYRTVPVPPSLLDLLDSVHGITAAQADPLRRRELLWPWCRTTGWQRVKETMSSAQIAGPWGTPKGLRHALGVQGTTEAGIPLNIMQRWLGHARLETTAIYADAVGPEERALAKRMWDIAQ